MPEKIAPRLLNWASLLEPNTRDQAIRTASLPFIHPHLALMPDAHLGKGATVGSVIPTDRAVIPAAVGVDIGCGMMAVRTQFTAQDARSADLGALRREIEATVPLSAGGYNTGIAPEAEPAIAELEALAVRKDFDPARYTGNWRLQLGSLGSGNHFIEVCLDELDRVWLFLHSGSRGIGNKIATHHIKVAQRLAERWWIDLPDPDLAYLVEPEPTFWAYITQMQWAQEFARLNREEMMRRVITATSQVLGADVTAEQTINCHHNYTTREEHAGREVWVSRKGAISAREGEWGLIPGSMGAASYVVRGLGNPASLHSSPHGAGRQYSRGSARRTFDLADLRTRMAGIEWRDSDVFLDEHPDAYKPIDVVMADAADLVETVHTLRQIVNVKGD